MLSLPRKRLFWAVGSAHMVNDIFMSMGVVLLAFLSASVLPMTNTQIGIAVSLKQIVASISQPFFGIQADRYGGRWVGVGGLLWVIVTFLLSIVAAVLTQNYILMLIPFVLQGLGSGAVHPVGSLHAAESNASRAGSNMAYFFLMGQFGLATGPTLIGVLLDMANPDPFAAFTAASSLPGIASFQANFTPIFFVGLLAIVPVTMMMREIPQREPKPRVKKTDETATSSRTVASLMPFLLLGTIVILRSLASPGSVNFIPLLFQEKGWSPAEYGLITSLFWVSAGVSGVFFGNLADRYDRRWIVAFSMMAAAPAFFLLPLLDGIAALLMALVAGGFSGGAHSLIVLLAQELMPASKGFASGAILGFIFGTGALGSLFIGAISDVIGLGVTFQAVSVAIALSGTLALILPKKRRD